MLAGFILLITAHSHALPVTETIYPTKAECEAIRVRLNERRPLAQLECGEVSRKDKGPHKQPF
ncbi:hypothetical protein [Mixta calida]|uniref:hypothetical protein n=1 Tax=Mixta calida TaxID=665913 RepID=UPI0028A65573|nr:hypothetical protein [Mixta calida]